MNKFKWRFVSHDLRSFVTLAAQILAAIILALGIFSLPVKAQTTVDPSKWDTVLEQAKGQTVYFHAWAGDTRINDYIDWAGERLATLYGVKLQHVKVTDAAGVVAQVLAEKTAGQTEGGGVDLVWINGENFAAMKENGLLQSEDWVTKLPNWTYVDVEGKPTVINDFTVPTDGLEAPWGMAQLVFIYDRELTPAPPLSSFELLLWAQEEPGRFTYPEPPDFVGSTFLKQLLVELSSDPRRLSKPATDETFAVESQALFDFLDELHPHLWRGGKVFPNNSPALMTLLADNEIDIAFSFTPGSASGAIADGDLPESVRTYVFTNGTIGNTHFLALPFNTSAKAGALVAANFLMSPKAQARKQDPQYWGDATVLDTSRLAANERRLFDEIQLGPATLSPRELSPTLQEPHPSWMTRLETAWLERYGVR